MPEQSMTVEVVQTHYLCDCGKTMLPTGVITTTHPPGHQHLCECGAVAVLGKRYPVVSYINARPLETVIARGTNANA